MQIIALLEQLVNGLLEAEEKFFDNPKDFYQFEKSVHSVCDRTAAEFMAMTLSSADQMLLESPYRLGKFTVQRQDVRTLLTTAGEVTFTHTLCKNRETQKYQYLLDAMLGLDKHERLSEAAEAKLLETTAKTSYAEGAKSIHPDIALSKTTVMNKVHQVVEEFPLTERKQKKQCEYLYIEADEDHIHEQHGDKEKKKNCLIGRLIYLFEGIQEECKGRKKLVNSFYLGGLYEGSQGVENLWKRISEYIEKNYDDGVLKRVFISGDGASWIKAGTDYIPKSLFCIDKFHLMKYINKAANQMLDEKEIAKGAIYKCLYKRDKSGFKEKMEQMIKSATKEQTIAECRDYILNNWAEIMRSLHNKKLIGCSAEGHVSHVYSDRMSSRPMGWSKAGADGMCKLRCYIKDYGEDRVIDLVKYCRQKRNEKATGTDGEAVGKFYVRDVLTDHYKQSYSYIERMQATIPGSTARKRAVIRSQFHSI